MLLVADIVTDVVVGCFFVVVVAFFIIVLELFPKVCFAETMLLALLWHPRLLLVLI